MKLSRESELNALAKLIFRVVCRCIGVFGDAVSSLFFEAIEEHWVTEDGHPATPESFAIDNARAYVFLR